VTDTSCSYVVRTLVIFDGVDHIQKTELGNGYVSILFKLAYPFIYYHKVVSVSYFFHLFFETKDEYKVMLTSTQFLTSK